MKNAARKVKWLMLCLLLLPGHHLQFSPSFMGPWIFLLILFLKTFSREYLLQLGSMFLIHMLLVTQWKFYRIHFSHSRDYFRSQEILTCIVHSISSSYLLINSWDVCFALFRSISRYVKLSNPSNMKSPHL